MNGTTLNDPAFGEIVFDGFLHGGWAGSFVDGRFDGFGTGLPEIRVDDDEDDADGDAGDEEADEFTKLLGGGSQDFLSLMEKMTGQSFEQQAAGMPEKEREAAMGMIASMRDMARRVDDDDGALDAEQLLKDGRFKVVVRNEHGQPPSDAQRAAWQAFRDGGDALMERILERLLATYQSQRPERLRWWAAMYGDSPETALPEVDSTRAMRAIVLPEEVRIHPDLGDGVTVGVHFDASWERGDGVGVLLRDNEVIAVGPKDVALETRKPAKTIEHPVFGTLRWDGYERWVGTYKSRVLRGESTARTTRFRFERTPEIYVIRSAPYWATITGEYPLEIFDESGKGPSDEQAAAYAAFTADPDAAADAVLAAMLTYYQKARKAYVKGLDPDDEDDQETLATFPELASPRGLLEIVTLQGVSVWSTPSKRRNKGVAIGLNFAWEDEHGLGVRWRDGRVEAVGDHEAAGDE